MSVLSPSYIVLCPILLDPANGIYSGINITGISVGDTAAFACGQGFELVGIDTNLWQ